MSKSTTPKLVILDLKCSRIIHILSPNAKTTKQARKYRKKKITTKPTTQHQKKAMERSGGDRQEKAR
jgi:hypothetical protein